MNRFVLSGLVLVGFLWAIPSHAITLHATDDAAINLNRPNKITGDQENLVVRNAGSGGERQVFVRFDRSPLPANATVEKAVLRLWTNKVINCECECSS